MRGLALALWLILGAAATAAFEIEDQITYPARGTEAQRLSILSTADRPAFEPILTAFQAANPGIAIDYTITNTTDLMTAIHDGRGPYDLAISSAMDLQTKLANDGFAQTYTSPATEALPPWAQWRDQVFAFTQERAVLVLRRDAFAAVPDTREALIATLRAAPETFAGRVGTYDVAQSGYGYLMATQDSRNSDSFWRLAEVMGSLDARLYRGSGDMIRDVSSGHLALAYNVLGSYARSQIAGDPAVEIVEFSDHVNVMLRTALIPVGAENPDAARAMIDFLVTLKDRPEVTARAGLPPIDAAALQANPALRPVRLGPGLLVFLDRLKRETFLRNWRSAVVRQ
ncbi:ABC transporter substrate-binding protein [Pseudaestuariivita sp.]|uniref:ABC transporter substrate-binding protein n=1 Tax=Pseudaestuariivita sp. TaxID=2211669 RepID=UPI0040589010